MQITGLCVLPEHKDLIALIDDFNARWKQSSFPSSSRAATMRKHAFVESVAASARLSGVSIQDDAVKNVIEGADPVTREEKIAAGCAEALEIVLSSPNRIYFSERHIMQLHRVLMRPLSTESRYRGGYKKLPNPVEAVDADGNSLGPVFQTASPEDTPRLMEELLGQYKNSGATTDLHILVRIAAFILQFHSIHPFQDGNGRLAFLLTNLLLIRAGYSHMAYCSIEKIVEQNRSRFLLTVRHAGRSTDPDPSNFFNGWISFFLQAIKQQVGILSPELAAASAAPRAPAKPSARKKKS